MTEKKIIPKLRFSEFEGEWGKKRLGEVAKFSKGKGVSKSDISATGAIECIRYGELYTHYKETISDTISRTDIPVSELVLSQENDVIIPASGETQIDIATASCILREGIALGSDLNIIKSSNNGIFLSYYLNNCKKNDIANLAQGISVVHLYPRQLALLELQLPSLPEQQKIALFLSEIDGKIQKIARKKELVGQFKKGMMQKLFSQEIRFKDDFGKEFPEWEEKRLGDFLTYTPRKIDKPIDGYWRLGLRSHAKGTFHEYVNDPTKNSMDELFVIEDGDLIVNITFAWEHAVAIASCNDAGKLVSHRFPTYVINPIFDKKFIHYLVTHKKFKYQLEGISPGGAGRNRVMSKKDFPEIIVTIPHPDEQQKIASFLTDIDIKITSIDRELSMLKEFKRGLLQQMFV